MSGVWIRLLLSACACVCITTQPQGSPTALPRHHHGQPDEQIEIHSVKIDCKVASRFAHTVMTSTALNKANVSQEVFFEVELPKTAFITNFSMEIDGQTYTGDVKEKEKARKQYETAVSSGQTAGLVKASGRKMEKFSVSVNIAANGNVTFTLTYEELLQRRFGKYEIMIRVKPKHLVQHFEIGADIYEPQGIAFLDINATFVTNELLPLMKKTVTDKMAHVSFSPTLDQQRKCPDCEGTLLDGDFTITYDVKREQGIGDIQIVNGYFVHFFAPADLPRLPKNVVFVIDRSGSMHGNKMKQTREALLTILDDLYEEDHFGLVTFDDKIELWRPSLSKATPSNIKEAKQFVSSITARDATDINGAVIRAVNMLTTAKENNSLPRNSASMIILLTDGDPTAGEQHLPTIQENVRNAIDRQMSLFCLGFGHDVDYSFLDVMAKQNDGLARRIYEGSDATVQLQDFYEEVASPLLLEVNLHYLGNVVNSLTNSHFRQLFNGSEVVVAGHLNDSEVKNVLVEVSAQGLEEMFVVHGQASAEEWAVMFPDQDYIFGDFTERLWAYLTIQQLLDKADKCTCEESGNMTAEALELSLRYNFVTPLTSMVVTKPQMEDKPEDALIADKLTEGQREDIISQDFVDYAVGYSLLRGSYPGLDFDLEADAVGLQGQAYPALLSAVDGDPHFIIELPDQNDALCFNINHKPGTIFNLVRDPLTGFVVNGQTIGDKLLSPGTTAQTYFGRFGIIHAEFGIRLMVTTQEITLSEHGKQRKALWTQMTSVKGMNMDLQVSKDHSLTVSLRNSVKFVIILHKVWKKHPYHQDYLGFYTLDSHQLSQGVHGLIGQFFHGVNFEVSGLVEGQDPGKPDATMFVKGHTLKVTRGWQRDFRQDVKNGENVPCWFIHHNGTGLIDGVHTDYIVPALFSTV